MVPSAKGRYPARELSSESRTFTGAKRQSDDGCNHGVVDAEGVYSLIAAFDIVQRGQSFGRVLKVVFSLLATLIAPQYAHGAQCGGPKPSPPFSELAERGVEVRIADIAWTTDIINSCPSNRISGTIAAPDRLYLWMRLQGGDAAIAELKREGRYPLIHKWEISLGGAIMPVPGGADTEAEFYQTDSINVTRKLPGQRKVLAGETALKGDFDWRTWSYKRNLHPGGYYRVKILDQKKKPVPCAEQLDCDLCEGGIRCAVLIDLQ